MSEHVRTLANRFVTEGDGFELPVPREIAEACRRHEDLVVPILQERGVYKGNYRPGNLREKLFAGSRLLPSSHPGAKHRRAAAFSR